MPGSQYNTDVIRNVAREEQELHLDSFVFRLL